MSAVGIAEVTEEINALKVKIDTREEKLEQPGISQDERVAIRNEITAYTQQQTTLINRRERLEQQLQASAAPAEQRPNIADYLGAAHILCIGDNRGNAVAISPTRALTALHQQHDSVVGTDIKLIDVHGNCRKGTVLFYRFENKLVDIAVVQLNDDENLFSLFLPVSRNPVRLMDPLYVVGITKNVTDESATTYTAAGEVNCIENGKDSALFRSYYHCFDGLSGSAIIMHLEPNGFHVVGVHVYADDHTSSPPPIKRQKSGAAQADSVSENSNSLASSLHGHSSYCMICEASRVEGIADYL